jgi:hypothetical protein
MRGLTLTPSRWASDAYYAVEVLQYTAQCTMCCLHACIAPWGDVGEERRGITYLVTVVTWKREAMTQWLVVKVLGLLMQ